MFCVTKFINVSGTMEVIHFEASYYRVTGVWLRLMEPNGRVLINLC